MNVQNAKVLEVQGNVDQEGRNVGVNTRNNNRHQRWTIIYVDKKAKEITKGVNRRFGFYVNRPFYIVSRMWMKRVIEVVGGRNLVIKTRVKNRNTQKFVFDQVSKTIKSVAYRGRSLDISNSGRSANLQIWNTNSRWW